MLKQVTLYLPTEQNKYFLCYFLVLLDTISFIHADLKFESVTVYILGFWRSDGEVPHAHLVPVF